MQSVALPAEMVDLINSSDNSDEILRSASQWRLDYPTNKANKPLSAKLQSTLGVLEKIFTRGKITTLTKKVEDILFDESSIDNIENEFGSALERLALTKSLYQSYLNYSATEQYERDLLETILVPQYGKSIYPFVTHQPLISGLLNADLAQFAEQRADFLIAWPGGGDGIVIEVDGQQHQRQSEYDAARDQALAAYGYKVIRIPTEQIKAKSGAKITQLLNALAPFRNCASYQNRADWRYLMAKAAHQLFIALTQAIRQGHIEAVSAGAEVYVVVDPHTCPGFNSDQTLIYLQLFADEYVRIYSDVSGLYGNDRISKINLVLFEDQRSKLARVSISYAGHLRSGYHAYVIADTYLPFDLQREPMLVRPFMVTEIDRQVCERMLLDIFRKSSFWPGQWECVERLLQQKDTVILMPTGAGKSISFQLAAMLMPGMTVVVEPLVALMEDQVANLKLYGIDFVCSISSDMSGDEREAALDELKLGLYGFIYVSPERFQRINFKESIRTMTCHTVVNLVVVDEAHCVSEWGHDFRPAYIALPDTARKYCATDDHVPAVVGLTGTASNRVLRDVEREMKIEDHDTITLPNFDRRELKFKLVPVTADEPRRLLLKRIYESVPKEFGFEPNKYWELSGSTTRCGIIFFPFVNGNDSLSIKNARNHLCINDYYCGERPGFFPGRDADWKKHKRDSLARFKHNKYHTILATKALGMGVDKPNIRYTIHASFPASFESYYQEAGRAGRDKNEAICYLLYKMSDQSKWELFTNKDLSYQEIYEGMESSRPDDDLSVLWFFHKSKYGGEQADLQFTKNLLVQLGNFTHKHAVEKSIRLPDNLDRAARDEIKKKTEVALNRLKTLGVVDEYGIRDDQSYSIVICPLDSDRVKQKFKEYARKYEYGALRTPLIESLNNLPIAPPLEFIVSITAKFIDYIYDTVEKGRRTSIALIMEALRDNDEGIFRQKMLDYLTSDSKISGRIDGLLNNSVHCFEELMLLTQEMASSSMARHYAAQIDRAVESQPYAYALYIARAVLELMAGSPDMRLSEDRFRSGLKYAKEQYSIDPDRFVEPASQLFGYLIEEWGVHPANVAILINLLITRVSDRRNACRYLFEHLPSEIKIIPLKHLVDDIATLAVDLTAQ